MKVSDAIKLGYVNIKAQKRRSIMMIIVIGVAFSLVFMLNFVLQGLKTNVMRIINQPSDGAVLQLTSTMSQVCYMDAGECERDDEKIAVIREEAERAGGTVIGEVPLVNGQYLGLPEEVLERVVSVNLDEVPEGVIPIVMSYSTAGYLEKISMPAHGGLAAKLKVREQIRETAVGKVYEQLGDEYFVVGMMPSPAGVSTLMIGKPDDMNPLNLLLGMIGTGGVESPVVLTEEVERTQSLEPSGLVLVSFPDMRSAMRYARNGTKICYIGMWDCEEGALISRDVFGNPIGAEFYFGIAQGAVNVLSVIIMVLALIVLFFTGLRLISQSGKTIALYHALGATKGDVCLVFLMYMLELCLMAAMFAMVVGLAGAVVISVVNMEELSMVVDLAYGTTGEKVWLVGWNWQMLGCVGMMVAMAPVCILLSLGQFSTKKLSKRLKV